MRALCVPQGALQPLQEESAPSETGTHSTVRDTFDALGVHCFFFFAFFCLQCIWQVGGKPLHC